MGKQALHAVWVLGALLLLSSSCGGGGGETSEPPDPPTPNETWTRTGGPLGGLGYDVRMRPGSPDAMLVTDAWAGVFKSADGGHTWLPTNRGITIRSGTSGDAIPVFCLTIDPHDPNIVWCGTQGQRGIFRSTNGGDTWTQRDDGVVEDEGITFRGFTVDPYDSDVVYAAAEISSWAWSSMPPQGREFDMTMGVVYRTTNAGESWTEIWRDDNLARYVWIDPRDTQVLYLSTGIFDREAANSNDTLDIAGGLGVLKSIDGGASWFPVNNGITNLYVGTLFMHPDNFDVLLAGAGNNAYPTGGGAFLTTNGGVSWTKVIADDAITSVEIAAANPLVMYAASSARVHRSVDGGTTWNRVTPQEHSWGAPGVRAGFPIDFEADPRNAMRVFANNYGGGNFLSEDGGETWSVASNGYTGAQVRAIAVDPAAPGRVLAAARSGIFGSSDGAASWAGLGYPEAAGLDWNAIAVDPSAPLHLLASGNWNGTIVESRDGGASWGTSAQSDLPVGFGWDVLAFAPSDPSVAYGGSAAYFSAGTFDRTLPAKGIFRSVNGGATWNALADVTYQDAHVAALAIARGDPNHLYAATTNHGVLKTLDGGANLDAVNTGLPAAARALAIAMHPENPALLFVGLDKAGLYRTENGGATWQQVPAGLAPEATITDVVIDLQNPETMYISDVLSGVYRSQDGGATWQPLNDNLRTRAVNELALSLDGEHLYAATEGEGVFRLDLFGRAP